MDQALLGLKLFKNIIDPHLVGESGGLILFVLLRNHVGLKLLLKIFSALPPTTRPSGGGSAGWLILL